MCSDHPTGEYGTHGVRKVSGNQAGLSSGQRGCAGFQGMHKYACACQPGECGMFAALVTFCL